MKRDFLTIQDITNEEMQHLLDSALAFKAKKGEMANDLSGKAVALLFQKPSNRTRVSFEIAVWQLGGKCIYLAPQEIDLGKRESVSDVAQTLSRYLDCIVARTYTHTDVVELAKHSSAVIINGLSDLFHPCQGVADILTIQEKMGKKNKALVAYIGDGNNVCHSLMLGCARVGFDMNIATPKKYEPAAKVVAFAKKICQQTGAQIKLTADPQKAVQGANVIYSDVWVSMGQEAETKKRIKDFQGFQINKELVKTADKNYLFMHCLPAHRGLEVTADIIDGPHAVVFDQAENRLHAQKAILSFLLGEKK